MSALSPRSVPHVDLLSGEKFGTSLMDDSLGQAYNVGYQFQQQQQSLPSLDGSVMEHGQSKFEQASFVQRAQSEVDQDGALPPPPWEIELSEINQTLTLQQQPQQNEQTREIITYSPIIQGNQPMGIHPPNDQASYLSNSYPQPMHGAQMEIYDYGQQSESQLYGYNASYSYSNNNELSHVWNGVSLQDRYQMASTATPYLQQPMKPLRADDDLFADLVSMAKSKTNKSSN
ncbi:uncharacterized protein LOC110020648 [Phalaenopsis equestris]|uniref:uncharacterized protein LOC110020648 n=1 Tax=Phalaenopsis equestris TaxID=78828 RepID=UPI0009E4C064|nr:uncharacterized protein LOC110020648 [Phalaenopsis equestris]